MPCGWVLLWLVLSHCPKAGCCHGLNSPHALWLGVTMALLSQCPKAGCCHRLNSPHALRLGVLKKERKNIRMVSCCVSELEALKELSETTASSTSSVREQWQAFTYLHHLISIFQ